LLNQAGAGAGEVLAYTAGDVDGVAEVVLRAVNFAVEVEEVTARYPPHTGAGFWSAHQARTSLNAYGSRVPKSA
jgi:hypothetical protein